MRDYKDKTKEELLEIIRELEEQLASRSLPTDPCPDEEPERFREKYGKEILEAIPDMLTVFDRNLDYIELLSSPDTQSRGRSVRHYILQVRMRLIFTGQTFHVIGIRRRK